MAFKAQTFRDKSFRITNSLGHRKVEFRPAAPPKVLFYSCGPTVYGPLHIGNARALYTGDLFFRWLKHIGYDVCFVRNYTDVDDKIIQRGHQDGMSAADVAKKFTDYCEEDMARFGISKPTRVVTVTESMGDIIALIESLIQRGHAYVVNGEVFYSVESFKEYGKLSGKKVDELQAGARVEVDAQKRHPADFALWKPAKTGEPSWESPWSAGRPGWHIECSAMAKRWLGDTIDIHHGGQDLIFPHHENEIAQSEGGNGKPFCEHWVHNAFLTVGREKMSKSLGNIFEIRAFLDAYGPEVLRYTLARHHYRSPFDFDAESLAELLGELERVYEARRWAEAAVAAGSIGSPAAHDTDAVWQSLSADNAFRSFEDELFNDLSTPGAISHVFTFIRALNAAELKAAGKPSTPAPATQARARTAGDFLRLLNEGVKPILNVFAEPTPDMLARIGSIRAGLQARSGGAVLDDAAIEKLLAERLEARKRKDFAAADGIRKQLDAAGVAILDGPQGTTWKRK